MLHGGGAGYESGLPVNKIEAFLPSLIPDLVLWIKANKTYLKEETIKSYFIYAIKLWQKYVYLWLF